MCLSHTLGMCMRQAAAYYIQISLVIKAQCALVCVCFIFHRHRLTCGQQMHVSQGTLIRPLGWPCGCTLCPCKCLGSARVLPAVGLWFPLRQADGMASPCCPPASLSALYCVEASSVLSLPGFTLAVCDPLSCTARGSHHQPSGLHQATLYDPRAP